MLTALEPADGEAILPLDKLKARVRVLSDSEDSDIERMRLQAIDHIERYSGISLMQRQFRLSLRRFCTSIPLLMGPATTVDEISYVDTAGDTQSADTGEWILAADYLYPTVGTALPVASGMPGSVQITFTAGLTDAENEAPLLIAAVEVAVAELFNNREAPNWTAAENVASSYRAVL